MRSAAAAAPKPGSGRAVKANRGQLEKALRAPAETRFFLLHGPDDSGSRALARLLGAAMGAEAERIDLSGSELKADPARLADEAASISMFGGARWILVDPAGDDCVPAAEALLDAPAAGNPVILLAGALKPASKLLKLALAAPQAMAFASYLPDARGCRPACRGAGPGRGPDPAARRRQAPRRKLRRQPRPDRTGAGQVRTLRRRLARVAEGDRP